MTFLPSTRQDDRSIHPGTPTGAVPEGREFNLTDLASLVRRSVWFMLAFAVVSVTGAVLYVGRLAPVYEAGVSLRIQERETSLPEIFRPLSSASGVSSEMQVLGSRTLVENATRELYLQLRVVTPSGIARDTLLRDLSVAPGAAARRYRLVRQPDGSFELFDKASGKGYARVRPGEQLKLKGASFRLTPAAARFEEVVIRVSPLRDAILSTQSALAVSRISREADVLSVRFRDPDPDLVWRVPNAVVKDFIKRREELKKLQAGGQVRFLRDQIDTLAVQLRGAEEELKRFRESARVVNPGEEATRQIGRLVELEASRSTIEAERSSLAKLLAQVDSERVALGTNRPTPYRRLFAFPSLFQSPAASQMITALTQVEDQRVALLSRRTEQDPEVQRLTARMAELESQLGSIARTYLQGLTDQVKSRDSTLARFGRELGSLPGKELQYARLERTPTVLKDMYTLLQTRLKEAEIAEAAQNSNVSVIDPAIAPRHPVASRTRLIVLGALMGGLLAGLSLGTIREFMDHTVRTRADVMAASGLAVLAMIPRISRRGKTPALIASKQVRTRRRLAPPEAPQSSQPAGPPRPRPKSFTFLPSAEEFPESVPEPEVAGNPAPATEPAGVAAAPASTVESTMTMSGLDSAIAEAYCILQTNVAFSHQGDTLRTLVLTSALPGEGKTTTAVNLALTLAQRGLSVLLVDGDMRLGKVHEVLGLTRAPGLCEVLQGGQTFEHVRRVVGVGDARELAVLTAGNPTSSPPALVGSHRMGALLEHVKQAYDLVIIDTPPVNILTDAALLGHQADGVVLVVRAGFTDSAALGYAIGQLHHVRAPTLGVVLNDIVLKRDGTYDGVYSYAAYASSSISEADEASG